VGNTRYNLIGPDQLSSAGGEVMTWVLIVIVVGSSFTVDFSNEQACQTAKVAIEKTITNNSAVFCVAKGEALL
jgi:hypothetical protein